MRRAREEDFLMYFHAKIWKKRIVTLEKKRVSEKGILTYFHAK